MGKLLLHITFILKSNIKNERVTISDYLPKGEIFLYDKQHCLIPIDIAEHINMQYTSNFRIGFQCDYIIRTSNDIKLLSEKDPLRSWKIDWIDFQHKLNNPKSSPGTILFLKNGLELWIEQPHSFLYQVATVNTFNHPGLDYTDSDRKFLNYKQRNWDFDVLSISVTDENFDTFYVQLV